MGTRTMRIYPPPPRRDSTLNPRAEAAGQLAALQLHGILAGELVGDELGDEIG